MCLQFSSVLPLSLPLRRCWYGGRRIGRLSHGPGASGTIKLFNRQFPVDWRRLLKHVDLQRYTCCDVVYGSVRPSENEVLEIEIVRGVVFRECIRRYEMHSLCCESFSMLLGRKLAIGSFRGSVGWPFTSKEHDLTFEVSSP